MTRERERNVSKHELWQLCGAVADKCDGLPILAQAGQRLTTEDVAAIARHLQSLAAELRQRRGPNPAERIPPRGNAVGGRKSAESKRRKAGER